MSDLALYVLVRNDLPSMNPGKAMAQVHHAGVQMMHKYSTNPMVIAYIREGAKQGANGFNTTIVLGATYDQIRSLNPEAVYWEQPHYLVCGLVIDMSYPFAVDTEIAGLIPKTETTKIVGELDNGKVLMVRPETTVAWFLGDRDNPEFRDMFAEFSLHP